MTGTSIGETPPDAPRELTSRLGAVPAGIAAALSESEQAHLAGLIQRAVEHETAELLTDALTELNKVPSFLRKPLMKLLTK
ncbi:hypothetical protein [Nocardia huaxiensis]|uniref:hypothetical protein n=1 Tax=Nocardia huaxiensis TaxID=2755382 RepID=UPI001E2B5613|nr:hypothetical protein [Nocardia huaxiensis]UFS96841.1 hypothetical protein LPY97_02610 [Nocardia huaxiensis]